MLFSLYGVSWSGDAGVRAGVVVLPFDMGGTGDTSLMRREIMEALASSLEANGAVVLGIDVLKELVLKHGVTGFDEKKAVEVARSVKAGFAITGAVRSTDKAIDVELKVIDTTGRAKPVIVKRSSPGLAGVKEALSAYAPEIVRAMAEGGKDKRPQGARVIERIEIEGNKRVDKEAVLGKLRARQGAEYSPDDVRDDIRALFSTGYFDDVSAETVDEGEGVALVYRVKEMPFVKKVLIKGNSELREDKIRGVVTVRENTALDRTLLNENIEKIEALYAEDGFFLAEVEADVNIDGVEAEVSFNIKEGPEIRVAGITIIGNKFFSDSDIKGFMSTEEKGIFSFVTGSGKFNRFILENDLNIILGKYFDNGFIKAQILDHTVLQSEDKKWFFITIALTEGEQHTLGSIDVKGDLLKAREELLEKVKIMPGEVFSRSRLSAGIDAIAEVYGNEGYAYVDIRPITKIDPEKRTVDVVLDIKKNELTYIERIDITGNTRTRDKVIRRELEIEEGGLFSSAEIKRSRNNLRRLGYFDDVRIGELSGSAPDKMNLNVEVKERPTGSVSAGFGYSSVDKLIGTASISQSNFLGTGIKLDISGTVSSSSSKYQIGFTEPWLMDRPISAGFDIYDTDKEYLDFNLFKQGFDIRFGFPLTERYTKGYVTYKLENVDITDVDDDASTYIKEQEGETVESSIRNTVKRDTRDDAFFPREGSVASASIELAGGPLGGTSWFVKYEADAIKYFSLPLDTTFSIRGSLGRAQGYSGHDVPIYEKYFLGGINTIRGFETRSIGPKDPETGDVIGGTTMMVANLEFLFPLIPEQNVRGLVFFDAGNSYEGPIDFGDIRTSAGLGIRWFSPLGPLRLELGFNLDPREGESSQQWDFAIGTVF
jgi:outer membrane protein insertion porin family